MGGVQVPHEIVDGHRYDLAHIANNGKICRADLQMGVDDDDDDDDSVH